MMSVLVSLLLIIPMPDEPRFVDTVITTSEAGTVVALRDLDGDGAMDLVRMDATGIGARLMTSDGVLAEENERRLPWPAAHLAWDLTDLEGDGIYEILMLLEGREVKRWNYDAASETGWSDAEALIESRSYLPRGLSQMDFARDVDGDGHEDLVLPGSGEYRIHLHGADGWTEPFRVRFEATIEHELGDPTSLTSRFGQAVEIPWFRMEDIDGDGRRDLVSERSGRVDFHIAAPEITATPTWHLDLAAMQDQLPRPGDDIDFSNLFSAIGGIVDWQVLDIDRSPPHDLVLQLGGTFKVYRNAATGGPKRTPDQILKSSGNVLAFLLRDVQGDELPELQILRAEKLGLGRVLRWLVLPGHLDFDLFTYRNDEGEFARRPTLRHTISIGIPRLLAFLDDIDEITDEIERQEEVPARALDLDGDGKTNDIVDLTLGKVLIWRDRIPDDYQLPVDLRGGDMDDFLGELVLKDLDRMKDGGVKTIELDELDEWVFFLGSELRTLCEGHEPDLVLPAGSLWTEAEIHARDIDGDGRADLVILAEPNEGERVVQLLVRR